MVSQYFPWFLAPWDGRRGAMAAMVTATPATPPAALAWRRHHRSFLRSSTWQVIDDHLSYIYIYIYIHTYICTYIHIYVLISLFLLRLRFIEMSLEHCNSVFSGQVYCGFPWTWQKMRPGLSQKILYCMQWCVGVYSTFKESCRAKQDVHWWKETVLFYLIMVLQE